MMTDEADSFIGKYVDHDITESFVSIALNRTLSIYDVMNGSTFRTRLNKNFSRNLYLGLYNI